MRWQLHSPFDKGLLSLALTLVALVSPHPGSAAEIDTQQLALEVYINDTPANLIGTFTQYSDRRIAARRAELTEVGLKPPGLGSDEDVIVIDGLAGIAYRYDEPSQKIYFTVSDEQRVVKTFDARDPSGAIAPARADFGSVLNYTLFASSTKPLNSGAFAFSGANATLEGRAFGPYGIFSQSAIVGTTTIQGVNALRLDTTWAYSNPESLMTYRAGDVISGGLTWSRPIRLGGLQMQRNFALRPDLVTLPLPTVSGSAAVPSTVDVYVNNLKTLSQQVPAGPFQITNVPVLSNTGAAQVVVRDAAGHQTQTSLPFYTSPMLLKEGLMNFSVEAGLPRVQYGTASSTYLEDPIGSASLRGGLHDWLTVETHAEGGAGLINGGIGAVTSFGQAGVVSVAGSASRFDDVFGFQSYVGYDKQFAVFSIHASSLRTFGTYNDLAAVTATLNPAVAGYQGLPASGYLGVTSATRLLTNIRPPKSLDTISLGLPLPFDKASLNLTLLHQVLQDGTRSNIASVSYSRPIFSRGSLFVTAFSDISDRKNAGVFFGISMPFGASATHADAVVTSTTVSATPTGTNVTFDASKSIQPVPGSYGWRVRDSEGQTPYRSAAASYRSQVGQFDGYVQQAGTNTSASIQAQGAVAAMGGGFFFSNRIDDAFAVIDAGAPDVDVLFENRPAGKTDAQGQLLIPQLKSYQKNKIEIDPRNLPVDADAPSTKNIAAPADRSGINVRFGIKTEVKAAVVILVDRTGMFIEPGSRGTRESTDEPFFVGYDGRAYVRELSDTNNIVVSTARGQCRASFPFAAKKNSQVVIGPVTCQ